MTSTHNIRGRWAGFTSGGNYVLIRHQDQVLGVRRVPDRLYLQYRPIVLLDALQVVYFPVWHKLLEEVR